MGDPALWQRAEYFPEAGRRPGSTRRQKYKPNQPAFESLSMLYEVFSQQIEAGIPTKSVKEHNPRPTSTTQHESMAAARIPICL
ncbi:hypothetical protein TMatcc_009412 [Talaromyces marneffei ATCC 18224]